VAGERAGQSRIWTIPNVLSMLRLALVPFFLLLIVTGDYVGALVVLVIASFTDLLDGYLARRLGQVTRLGQLLDPAADRLYIFAALVGLAAHSLVPWWIVVVIVARDLFLLVLGVVLANHGYGPLPVHQLGKVATFALFFGVPVIMLGLAFPAVLPVLAHRRYTDVDLAARPEAMAISVVITVLVLVVVLAGSAAARRSIRREAS
jgi:cardiolipin synthase